MLLRAVGPTLSQFGVNGVLVDPQLGLFTGSIQTNQNDDWANAPAVVAASMQVGAFALTGGSKDAALVVGLQPNAYSAQVSSNAGSGVTLVEIYDADIGDPSARFVNLSARNRVGTGDDILITGFNITGTVSKTLLIRAIGPTLANFEVPGFLLDPKLEVYSGSTLTQSNDDWGGNVALATAFTSVGAFPLSATSKDSVLLVTLQPGSYSAQVSGVSGTSGTAIVEIYEMP